MLATLLQCMCFVLMPFVCNMLYVYRKLARLICHFQILRESTQ